MPSARPYPGPPLFFLFVSHSGPAPAQPATSLTITAGLDPSLVPLCPVPSFPVSHSAPLSSLLSLWCLCPYLCLPPSFPPPPFPSPPFLSPPPLSPAPGSPLSLCSFPASALVVTSGEGLAPQEPSLVPKWGGCCLSWCPPNRPDCRDALRSRDATNVASSVWYWDTMVPRGGQWAQSRPGALASQAPLAPVLWPWPREEQPSPLFLWLGLATVTHWRTFGASGRARGGTGGPERGGSGLVFRAHQGSAP